MALKEYGEEYSCSCRKVEDIKTIEGAVKFPDDILGVHCLS